MTVDTTALKDKVAEKAASNGAAVEKAGPPTIGQLIERMKPEIARALPKHMDADRLARIALTVIRQNPGLAKCTPDSLLGALMTSAQLGLEPGPLGHSYFVPFGREVTFIVGYRGYIDLARRSGNIESLVAREVYEHDTFEVAYGLDDRLVHEPLINGERGQVIAYYAVARYVGGGHTFLVMSRGDVEKFRKRSRSGNNGPWVSDYDAMAKKTCIRQLAKWLPLSVEFAQAMTQDGAVRSGVVTADAVDETPDVTDVTDVIDGEVVNTGTGEFIDGDADALAQAEMDAQAAAEEAGR